MVTGNEKWASYNNETGWIAKSRRKWWPNQDWQSGRFYYIFGRIGRESSILSCFSTVTHIIPKDQFTLSIDFFWNYKRLVVKLSYKLLQGLTVWFSPHSLILAFFLLIEWTLRKFGILNKNRIKLKKLKKKIE